jgi:hypothetical protein
MVASKSKTTSTRAPVLGRALSHSKRKRQEDEMGKEPDEGGAKDPENEAESPSSMPKAQQGQGGVGKKAHHDLEGQQGGTKGGGHEND